MKIVHISTSDTGGAGIAAIRLHSSLLDAGVNSSIITKHKQSQKNPNHFQLNPEQNILKRVLIKAAITTNKFRDLSDTHLANRLSGNEYFSFPFSEIDITEHTAVKSADIIHLHWVSERFLDFESFFSKINKPVVWTLHDMNPFTGGCHHADGCKGFMSKCYLCPQLKGTIDENFAAKILTIKSKTLTQSKSPQLKIISPSKWLMNLSSNSKLFSKYEHYNIPNIIDIQDFPSQNKVKCRQELKLPLDKKILLFIANDIDNPRKGIKILQEAMALVNEDVIVCGVGKNKSLLSFSNYIELGYVSDTNKLSKIYNAADVFVLPSIAENFPNTICESLLSGTPIVAFDIGGIPELVESGNGKLASYKNSKSLAESISWILENPQLFDRKRIRENALELLDLKTIVKQHINLYQSIL